MKLQRALNAKKGMAWGLINQISSMSFAFVLRIVVIRQMGAEYLGLSSLFSSIFQVLNLTELGFGSALVFSMYKPIAENDNGMLCAILNYYKKVYRTIGMVMLVGGISVLPFLKYLIKGGYPSDINIYVLYVISIIASASSYLLFAYYGSLLAAYQRVDIQNIVYAGVLILLNIGRVVIIIETHNYYLYALATLPSNIVINLLTTVIAKKLFPQIIPTGEISEEFRKDLRRRVGGLMIGKISGVSRNSFDSIFVSSFIGLVETAMYNNYFMIINTISAFMLIISSSLQAGIGNSVAMDNEDKRYSDLMKLEFVYIWISSFCVVCLACLFQPFTELAFGKNMLFPVSTMLMFCVYFYSLKLGDMRTLYSTASGIWWERKIVYILETVLNLLLNYVLGKYFGAIGIVAATTITILLVVNGMGVKITFKYCFPNHDWKQYLSKQFIYTVITIIITGITYYITSFIECRFIIGTLFIRLIVCTLVSNILFLIIYYNTTIYEQSVSWVLTMLGIDPNKLVGRIILKKDKK